MCRAGCAGFNIVAVEFVIGAIVIIWGARLKEKSLTSYVQNNDNIKAAVLVVSGVVCIAFASALIAGILKRSSCLVIVWLVYRYLVVVVGIVVLIIKYSADVVRKEPTDDLPVIIGEDVPIIMTSIIIVLFVAEIATGHLVLKEISGANTTPDSDQQCWRACPK